jgi:hypothetical protein
MATPSLEAAQSLDAAFITAITSSGCAAAKPSSCSTTRMSSSTSSASM